MFKGPQKMEFVRQLQRSGAGRGRRGTAKAGEDPANITMDTRLPQDGAPSDFDLLRDQAAKDGPNSPLARWLAVRERIRQRTRADGSGRPAVPFRNRGLIRALREGQTMAGYHPDLNGHHGRRVTHDTPVPNVSVSLDFRATREHLTGAPALKDHETARFTVHRGESYLGLPVAMGALSTSTGLTIQHRPGRCSCPRLSFVDDVDEDYDAESEAVWQEEIERERAANGVTAEDDAAAWEWPEEDWILGGNAGVTTCCKADLDPATRYLIRCSAQHTHAITFGNGSQALAFVTGRDAAEIKREMLCSPAIVREWTTTMLGIVSKEQTGKKRKKTHGAGRDLDWAALCSSHSQRLRELADALHSAKAQGTFTAFGGDPSGAGAPCPSPHTSPPHAPPSLPHRGC